MSVQLSDEKSFENLPSIEAKALRINLNNDIYGTFAEIGAGQEVARHFFRVGVLRVPLPRPSVLTIRILVIPSMVKKMTNAM